MREREGIIDVMNEFAKQQIEQAVDTSLRIAAKNVTMTTVGNIGIEVVDKQSILNCKPEILKELNK